MNMKRMKVRLSLVIGMVVIGVLMSAKLTAQQAPVTPSGWKFNGFVQFWGLANQNAGVIGRSSIPAETWGFRIRRARFGVRNDFDETFSFFTMTDLAVTDRVLLDAALVARLSPLLTLTAGQFTAPGQMYETSSILSNRMALYEISDIGSAVTTAMGYSNYRDVGIMAGGTWDMVRYAVYAGNGTGRLNFAGSTIANRTLGQGLFGGRIDVQPMPGFFLGGHYSVNRQDSVNAGTSSAPIVTSTRRSSYSVNAFLEGVPSYPGLFLDAEYGNGMTDDGTGVRYNGWYVTAGYRVMEDLQIAARFDTYSERKPASSSATTRANNVTAGLTKFFTSSGQELVRAGLNVEWRQEEPTEVSNNLVVLWSQVRF